MEEKITTLVQVSETLENQGYKVSLLPDEAVMVDVNATDNPFIAVITENKNSNQFVVTCQLAEMGNIDDDLSAQFMLAALDANTSIRPYAFAIISDTDDEALEDPEKWPVVLTSSMPIGDFSEGELVTAMDDLWEALAAAVPVLKLGLK